MLSFSQEVQDELLKESVRGREHFRKLLSIKTTSEQLQYIRSLVGTNADALEGSKRKKMSRSIVRLSVIDGVLKVQSYSLNRISLKEREDVRRALLSLVEQLEDKTVRGREQSCEINN